MDDILIILIAILIYFFPIVLTIINLVNIIKKEPFKENLIDSLTFVAGIILSFILFSIWEPLEYTEPIILDGINFELHTPVAWEHMLAVCLLAIVSLIGYLILRVRKNDLPPINLVLCISAAYIGIALSSIFIIQLSKNIFSSGGTFPLNILYMTLFPLNYILCSIRLIRQVIRAHTEQQACNDVNYNNKILQCCHNVLRNSYNWYIAAFIAMLPLLLILTVILVLFGQMPDSAIRAFTDTSDWTLSQKISPPPIKYEGHYLCTVAVNGHKHIVKPIRAGIRHGVKITVNRQLCIANAFEQLIAEKTPSFHRLVRAFYDNFGYPISKHITSQVRADVIYIVMKPLEWIFLIVLYMFDLKPENRISMQYTGRVYSAKK